MSQTVSQPTPSPGAPTKLKKTLKPIHLWAIAVGMVISGQYYGFSYGYAEGGPLGLLIAFLIVTVFYVTFVYCYTELATSIPHAGGPSAYARRAMGPFMGFLSGFSILIELVFAPAAVVLSIGAYIHFMLPGVPAMVASIIFLVVFILINFIGIKLSAVIELVVTVAAIIGLCIFYILAIPHFEISNVITTPALPNGAGGVFAAITFAIWFYLALEGAAMSAEEMRDPKEIPRGYIPAIFTLFVTALATVILVPSISNYLDVAAVDFPLPLALSQALGEAHFGVFLLGIFGLIGLIASLQGIIVGYSRQTYAMARSGYLPSFLAKVHPTRRVPHWALFIPGIITLIAALSGLTSTIITITVFGACFMYVISIVSLIILREKEPDMERPFKVSFYPFVPIISLIFALVLISSVFYFNIPVLKYVLLTYVIAIIYYFVYGKKNLGSFDEEFNRDI